MKFSLFGLLTRTVGLYMAVVIVLFLLAARASAQQQCQKACPVPTAPPAAAPGAPAYAVPAAQIQLVPVQQYAVQAAPVVIQAAPVVQYAQAGYAAQYGVATSVVQQTVVHQRQFVQHAAVAPAPVVVVQQRAGLFGGARQRQVQVQRTVTRIR